MKQGIQDQMHDEMLRKFGCYFLSVVQLAEEQSTLSLPERVLDLEYYLLGVHRSAVERGWVDNEYEVLDAAALYNMVAGVRLYRSVTKQTEKPDVPTYIICNEKPGYKHFTLCLRGKIWDPKDPKRPAAKDYKPTSYRVLKELS